MERQNRMKKSKAEKDEDWKKERSINTKKETNKETRKKLMLIEKEARIKKETKKVKHERIKETITKNTWIEQIN